MYLHVSIIITKINTLPRKVFTFPFMIIKSDTIIKTDDTSRETYPLFPLFVNYCSKSIITYHHFVVDSRTKCLDICVRFCGNLYCCNI